MISDATAVILCGGLSSRMGTPKHELFLDRIISQLQGFGKIALSVRDEAQVTGKNIPTWPDCVKDCGPLGGILTALKRADTPYVFVTPCDVPDITGEFITELFAELRPEDVCVVPVVDGKIQPLTGIYHVSCAEEIERSINSRNYSVKKFLESLNVHYVNFGRVKQNIFRNINTKEDYRDWQNKTSV